MVDAKLYILLHTLMFRGASITPTPYLRFILGMNLSNLLLDIHPLHPLHFLPLVQLFIITRGSLLPPRLLFFANDRLTRDAIKDIGTLRGETFQVGRYVRGRQVGG